MTKLTEWLAVVTVLFSIWWMLATKKIGNGFTEANEHVILFAPVYAILIFGAFSASVVFYRVFTFNDCDKAAEELKSEIVEATADLKRLGFVFREEKTS